MRFYRVQIRIRDLVLHEERRNSVPGVQFYRCKKRTELCCASDHELQTYVRGWVEMKCHYCPTGFVVRFFCLYIPSNWKSTLDFASSIFEQELAEE